MDSQEGQWLFLDHLLLRSLLTWANAVESSSSKSPQTTRQDWNLPNTFCDGSETMGKFEHTKSYSGILKRPSLFTQVFINSSLSTVLFAFLLWLSCQSLMFNFIQAWVRLKLNHQPFPSFAESLEVLIHTVHRFRVVLAESFFLPTSFWALRITIAILSCSESLLSFYFLFLFV